MSKMLFININETAKKYKQNSKNKNKKHKNKKIKQTHIK